MSDKETTDKETTKEALERAAATDGSATSVTFAENRYDNMLYRKCGDTGLYLPAVSLGAWETFGGYRGEDVVRECLYRAFDLGITHFDLANNYGRPPGNAERVVGKILKSMPRDELIISTKAGYRMWPGPYGDGLSKKYMVASLDQSLQRLGLDYVDIYYAHRTDPNTPLEETLEALDIIVKQGKALYIGVSSFSGAHLEQAVRLTQKKNLTRITIDQPRYNLFDRKIERNLLDHTERNGIGVIAFSPLDQGKLSDKYLGNRLPGDSRAAEWWGKQTNAEVLDARTQQKLAALNELARKRDQSLAQMALAWILRFPSITSVLIGASKVAQIEENVSALKNLEFTPEELARIDQITEFQSN